MDRDVSMRGGPWEAHLPSLFTAARNSVQADPFGHGGAFGHGLGRFQGTLRLEPRLGLPASCPSGTPKGPGDPDGVCVQRSTRMQKGRCDSDPKLFSL